jgi:hypothetical protein
MKLSKKSTLVDKNIPKIKQILLMLKTTTFEMLAKRAKQNYGVVL